MRVIYSAPILVAFILACGGGGVGDLVPTPSGYQARLDALIGKPINVAVAELGAPTRTVDMAGGSRLYVWEEKSELRTPITGEERYNPETRSETIVLNPSQRVPLDCFTELETDPSGIVTRNRKDGIACLATPPGPGYASTLSAQPMPPVALTEAPPEVAGTATGEDKAVTPGSIGGLATGPFPGAVVAAPGGPGARAERRAQRRAERGAAREADREQGE